MDMTYGAVAIVLVCGIVFLIGFLRKRAEIVLNFFVRMIVGLVGIYVVNLILARNGIALAVGLNAVSALTVGSLGFGGFLLLYGVVLLSVL